MVVGQLFDIDLLDDDDPFEITGQAPHLFKHGALGVDDIFDVWHSDPLFYPAKASGSLADGLAGQRHRAGCPPRSCGVRRPHEVPPYRLLRAAAHLAARYMEDR